MKISLTLAFLMGLDLSHAKTIRGLQNTIPSLSSPATSTSVVARDDTYTVQQGEDFRVRSGEGLLANDNSSPTGTELEVTRYEELSPFSGDLTVDTEGRVRYWSRDSSFIGTDRFTYQVCLKDVTPAVCSEAEVTITVEGDPRRPNALPVAVGDTYTVEEGERLEVSSSGFLSNDRTGTPSNGLYRCDRGGRTEGDLDTHDDGSFEYTAPLCWTGTDTFTYRACYVDYPEMESNEATVNIIVTTSSDRPDRPNPRDETFTVEEAESFEIDLDDNDLYISDYSKSSGFEGDLDLAGDRKKITYRSVAGKRGQFRFTMTVCHDDWSCVGCGDATITMNVITNPDKPGAPTTTDPMLEIEEGAIVDGNVLDYVTKDSKGNSYTLWVTDSERNSPFKGLGEIESNGDFEYGSSQAGDVDSFDYTVCYQQWPDVCADGKITITTKPGAAEMERADCGGGTVTVYEVSWQGSGQGDCEPVQPVLSVDCSGAPGGVTGRMDLLSVTDVCSKPQGSTAVTCDAANSGSVVVQCCDRATGDEEARKLVGSLTADSVSCSGTGISSAYQFVSTRVWCNDAWTNGDLECAGDSRATTNADGVQSCIAGGFTMGGTATPGEVEMGAKSFEECTGDDGIEAFTGALELTIVGDADGDLDAPGYPLGECEGDCDFDEECAGDLICFPRRDLEPVPGCYGGGEETNGRDFCVKPQN